MYPHENIAYLFLGFWHGVKDTSINTIFSEIQTNKWKETVQQTTYNLKIIINCARTQYYIIKYLILYFTVKTITDHRTEDTSIIEL